MTAPKREQFANNAADTLNGAINNSVTSLAVNSASEFPTDGNFRIIIESEILLVTAVSTNTFTVVRGQEGTTAASHSSGAVVTQILTKDSIDRGGKDNVTLWGYSGLPPLNKLVGTDGSTILTSSDFTWVNQGTTVVTDQGGTVAMRLPTSSGENVRVQKRAAPSTPYSLVAAVRVLAFREGIPSVGIGFRESSTGELVVLAFSNDGTQENRFIVYKFNSATSFSAAYSGLGTSTHCLFIASEVWLKITDNGTNLIFYASPDGVEWAQLFSISRTDFMAGGPDEILWFANNQGSGSGHEMLARLMHWHTE